MVEASRDAPGERRAHRSRSGGRTNEQLARHAAEAAVSRRALSVTILDLRGRATFTDFFVVCTATSDTHGEGVAEIVIEKMREVGERPWHSEGDRHAQWRLLDYVDVIVHIFASEAREFYALERLWSEAPATVIKDDRVGADPEWEEQADATPGLTGYTAMDDIDDDESDDDKHEE